MIILEKIATEPKSLFISIVVVLFLLKLLPKFPGRRRIASGLLGAFAFQIALIWFGFPASVESLNFALFAAIIGSMIKEEMDKLVR